MNTGNPEQSGKTGNLAHASRSHSDSVGGDPLAVPSAEPLRYLGCDILLEAAPASDRQAAEDLRGSAFYYGNLTEEEWLTMLVNEFAAVRADLLAAAKEVEAWWLREGQHAFNAAPVGMFMLRQAIADLRRETQSIEATSEMDSFRSEATQPPLVKPEKEPMR